MANINGIQSAAITQINAGASGAAPRAMLTIVAPINPMAMPTRPDRFGVFNLAKAARAKVNTGERANINPVKPAPA